MRNYLLFYIAVVMLLAWQADRYLTARIRSTHEDRYQLEMNSRTNAIVNHLQNNLSSNDEAHILQVLESYSANSLSHFQLINGEGQLWYDSEQGKLDFVDESNKSEVISSRNSDSRFLVRNDAMFSTRNLIGEFCHGLVRVTESYQPVTNLIQQTRQSMWLLACAIGLLGGMIMFVFARRSLSPLDEFARIAGLIGIGKYDTVPALHSRSDNWTILADAFRQMQEELEKREISILDNSSRLQAVLSSMIEGVLAIDAKGRIMLANGAGCDMLQVTQADVFGRDFMEIFRIPELSKAIEKTQRDHSFSKCEFQTRNLPRRIIKARVSVLRDIKNSQKPGIAIVLHDVTELRQLETLRRDFVANVSHELKTPLASIKAYAETLKLGAINDQQKNMHFVEHIEAQADLLNVQIQDLLQLARVESGQKNWEIAPISINEIAKSCIHQFSSEAESRKIKLEFLGAENELFAHADKDGIRTILTNLISNALHHTGENGTVKIHVTANDSSLQIEVVDDGIGISHDHHARIFERFYRVDQARSRENGGTGLGLAIVKHLCQAFRGSVELESKLGEGSRFTVKLPKVDQ